MTADELIALVRTYNPKTNAAMIADAFAFGDQMHEGQFRHSGEPYFTHPVAVAAILAEAGAGPADVVRINAFVTDRAHMADYMAARDRWLAGVTRLPASTLMIVSGFTRPEFLVEVEAGAAVSG